jgi:S1-C subfamily serine protease
MKKFSIGLLVGILLMFSVNAFAAVLLQETPFTLFIDDVKVEKPLYADANGTTYAPLWEISEKFGIEAKLDGNDILLTTPKTDTEAVAEKCKDSCVMIYGYDVYGGRYQGSGWVYNGYVITARHVVIYSNEIEVYGDNGEYSKGKIVYDDKDLDVAVLKVNMDLPTVTLGDTAKEGEGEVVISISSPKGYLNMIDECIYCGIQETTDSTDINLSETFVTNGSSGGAIFNKNSEIIGMLYFDSGGITSAIPISDIKPILEKLK